jgi:hypothetical protein
MAYVEVAWTAKGPSKDEIVATNASLSPRGADSGLGEHAALRFADTAALEERCVNLVKANLRARLTTGRLAGAGAWYRRRRGEVLVAVSRHFSPQANAVGSAFTFGLH